MEAPINKILIDEETLLQRVHELADEINAHYNQSDEIIVISILKGSVLFMADLVKQLKMSVEFGFLFFSSYGGGKTPQTKIKVFELPIPDLHGRHVLLIEDIFDTGASIKHAYEICAAHNPASLKTCVLLVKEKNIDQKELTIDFKGFDIPNQFVVGYGLDYNEKYRNLPFIGVLNQ